MYYEPTIPKKLLEAAGPATGKMDIDNTRGHFALVNHQIKEVRKLLHGSVWSAHLVVMPLSHGCWS
jgi:hypothetical protein